uniref:RRM domain-containing protein n=1 Tax=Strigamia maritima TaxID=126957 RepID=T1J0I6_STRMM
MASSGKKGRKVKGKTIDLHTFLANETDSPQAGYAVAKSTKNWADEMENEQLDAVSQDKYPGIDGAFASDKYILPTMPRAARDPCNDMNLIPNKPPYTAFVANLSYEIDQEDIASFFKHLRVKSIRLPREGPDSSRHKGFGYADFEDRESLIEGLKMNDESLRGRKVRIHVAESQDNDRDRDRRDDKSDRTVGDWRARDDLPPKEDRYSRNGPERFTDRSDRDWHSGDRGGDRGGERGSYTSRNYERNRDDRGPSSERPYSSAGDRDRGYDRGGYRERDRGFDRDRDRDGFDRGYQRGSSRRDYRDDNRRGDDRRDDQPWGHNDRRDDFRRRDNDRGSNYEREPEKGGSETQRERPKLIIKPRSVPVDAPKEAPQSNSSIFGGARPVDTAARERQIEARLQQEKENKFSAREREPETERRSFEVDKWDRKDDRSEDSYESESHRREDFEESLSERVIIKKSNSVGGTFVRNSPRSSTSSHIIEGHRPESERSANSLSEHEDDKSEKSIPIGKPPSPRKEDNKAVPAPPPKENAWQRKNVHDGEKENRYSNTVPRGKRSSSISSNTSSGERDNSRRSVHERPPSGRRNEDGKREEGRQEEYRRDDSATQRRNVSERGSGRMGSGSNQGRGNHGEKNSNRRDNASSYNNRSSHDQGDKKVADMPKYEESKAPVSIGTE